MPLPGMPAGMPPTGAAPGLPGAPPAGGPNLAAILPLLSMMGKGGGARSKGSPDAGGGMDAMMPFMSGIGFQSLLGQITKFLKTISTVGTRGDKSTRVPMQPNVGPMDQAAMQAMRAQQMGGMAAGAMPAQGPAQLPVGMPPMRPPGM